MTTYFILQFELLIIFFLLWTHFDYIESRSREVSHDLRKIKQILRYGIRVFPIATNIVFLNLQGEKVTQMNIQDSGQVLTLSFSGVDAAGNPAPLDSQSAPVFSLDNTAAGVVSAAGVFTPSGTLGSVNLSVSIPAVNAQPALAGSLAVSVVAGAAVQLTIAGAVSPAPAAPSA